MPIRCDRASSTTTCGDAVGAGLDAALDAAAGAVLDNAGDAGEVEADATALDVPAVGVLDDGAADGLAGADVDVLACLVLEVHAVATIASATRVATLMRDDVSTGLLK